VLRWLFVVFRGVVVVVLERKEKNGAALGPGRESTNEEIVA
jgi:hypothetical protein